MVSSTGCESLRAETSVAVRDEEESGVLLVEESVNIGLFPCVSFGSGPGTSLIVGVVLADLCISESEATLCELTRSLLEVVESLWECLVSLL